MYSLYYFNGDYWLSEMNELDFILASQKISKSRVVLEIPDMDDSLVDILMENGIRNFDERFPDYVDHITGV
jgi:hypothetical protein